MEINQAMQEIASVDQFLKVFDNKLEADTSLMGGRRVKVKGFEGDTSLKRMLECYDTVMAKAQDLSREKKLALAEFLGKFRKVGMECDEKIGKHAVGILRQHKIENIEKEVGSRMEVLYSKFEKSKRAQATKIQENPLPVKKLKELPPLPSSKEPATKIPPPPPPKKVAAPAVDKLKDISKGQVIGATTLKRLVKGKWENVEVTFKVNAIARSKKQDGDGDCYVFDALNDKKEVIGYIEFITYKTSEENYAFPNGKNGEMYLFVEGLYTKKFQKTYKGVGSSLLQLALEVGKIKKCEGRVLLSSVGLSAPFYLNEFHMKLASPNKEKSLNNEIRNFDFKNRFFEGVFNEVTALCNEVENTKNLDPEKVKESFKQLKEKLLNDIRGLDQKYKKLKLNQTREMARKFAEELPPQMVQLLKEMDQVSDYESVKKLRGFIKDLPYKDRDLGSFILYIPKEHYPKIEGRMKANPIFNLDSKKRLLN